MSDQNNKQGSNQNFNNNKDITESAKTRVSNIDLGSILNNSKNQDIKDASHSPKSRTTFEQPAEPNAPKTNASQNSENQNPKSDPSKSNPSKSTPDINAENEAKIQQLSEQLLRKVAEIENNKKAQQKEISEIRQYASSSVLSDIAVPYEQLFTALTNVDSANASPEIKTITQGIELIKSGFESVMTKHGLERVNPINEQFDPASHQATSQIEVEGVESNIIVQVIQAGYKLNNRVLKPAIVIVSK